MTARVRLLAASLALTGLMAHATPALAVWPTNPATNLLVCAASGDQRNAALLPDGSGGAFIAWWDFRAGISQVYAQRVDQGGVPRWGSDGIALSTSSGAHWGASLLTDGAGGFIATWSDSSLGYGNARQYAQRFDAGGRPLWATGGVRVCPVETNQSGGVRLEDGAGGVFVVWTDARYGSYDLFAQRLDAAGQPLWTADGVPLCTAAGDQLFQMGQLARVVSDGAGGFIVTWYDQRAGTGSDDIYVQRVSASGVPLWTANGVPLCTATGEQQNPVLCGDGAGGAIVAWRDLRSGVYRVYLQRVSAAGTPLWGADGVQASLNGVAQTDPRLVEDRANGAILVWLDNRASFDIYAQRVNASGAPLWSSADVCLVADPADQFGPMPEADGAGGAIVTWRDERSGTGNSDVYAQHVDALGNILWGGTGTAISTLPGDAVSVRNTTDGAGGLIVAWSENRGGAQDLVAQRITADGALGGREPRIAAVADMGPDQGGHVRVLWDHSDLDSGLPSGIESYTLWRRVITVVGAAVESPEFAMTASGRVLLREGGDGIEATYWEFLKTIPAIGESGYAFAVATEADSMPALTPWETFRVMAKTVSGRWYASAPESGYSVDNLAPAAPGPLAAERVSGVTRLHWSGSHDADLAGYRLHAGSTADFVPGEANLVATVGAPAYDDAGPAGRYYKLAAVDLHGNPSDYVALGPSQIAGVAAGGAPTFGIESLRPNPVRGRELSVDVALPDAGAARLEWLDLAGRRIAEWQLAATGPGRRTLRLARPASPGPGIYFVRLTQGARTHVRRCAVLD